MDTLVRPTPEAQDTIEHFDVLIVGAGLSGIGAAWHLQDRCPTRSFAILEGREASGGTWDLFRYPGVRSDSDMYTLGYRFRPWKEAKAIADGPSILKYIREVAHDHGIDAKIRYRHRVVSAAWSTPDARWTVEVGRGEAREPVRFTCNFLWMCSGYYRTDSGYLPEFPGIDRFRGRIVHPQKWTDDIDYAGKKVVVIGSGATAVTLVPSMATTAGHVTMLQRSPTYVMPVPAKDGFANTARKLLGDDRGYALARRKNIAKQRGVYTFCQKYPTAARWLIRRINAAKLPDGYPVDEHFSPSYNPWDQRLCAVPDGDLFEAISNGSASVVTDRISTFTERGVLLESGRELDADIIVTATGLNVQLFGGITLTVDGEPVDFAQTVAYKGIMLSGIPNFAFAFGYTNSSWTLKVGLLCEHFCRLLSYMDDHGFDSVRAELDDPAMPTKPLLDFAAGYVQ